MNSNQAENETYDLLSEPRQLQYRIESRQNSTQPLLTTRTTIEQFFFDSKFMTFQCLRNSLRFPMAEEAMGTLDHFPIVVEKLIDFRCSPSTANMVNSLHVWRINLPVNHGATTLQLRPLCNLFVIEFLERSGFDGDDGDFHYRNRNFSLLSW